MENILKSFMHYVIMPVVLGVSTFFGSIFYKRNPKIPQDNPIEEAVEDVIEAGTGVAIDLSPDTPDPSHAKDK